MSATGTASPTGVRGGDAGGGSYEFWAQTGDVAFSAISLVVALTALLVAAFALQQHLVNSRLHAVAIEPEAQKCASVPRNDGTTQVSITYVVRIRLVGPAPMLNPSPMVWHSGGRLKALDRSEGVDYWVPGDDPLSVSMIVKDAAVRPNQIWVGLTWGKPFRLHEGLAPAFRRFSLLDENGEYNKITTVEDWSFRKNRWVKRKRPVWLQEYELRGVKENLLKGWQRH